MHTGDLATPKFRPSLFGGKPANTSDRGDRSNGFGFGNQGEKQAGLKGTCHWQILDSKDVTPNLRLAGFITTVPAQAAPLHVPRPSSLGSSLYSVVEPKIPEPEPPKSSTFRSSPTAI